MKKIVSLIAAGLMVAAVVPGVASAGKAKGARQDVEGHIALQAPPGEHTDNPNGCYSGVHRRLNEAAQMNANGIVGYHFEIDPATWNKKFRLTPVTPDVDIDITFYTRFGTVEEASSFVPVAVGFEERNTDGEFGKVPADMTLAIVCMKVGSNADFTYSAGAGVK